jgi:hypothetical protein
VFRPGIEAEMLHRFTLGRTLDDASTAGGDRFVQELALAVCAPDGMALRVNHLDPASVSLSGEDIPDRAEQALTMPHGSPKDTGPT